jgi:hypothetical protein
MASTELSRRVEKVVQLLPQPGGYEASRSSRYYGQTLSDRPLAEEDLDRAAVEVIPREAGDAPSHGHRQGWSETSSSARGVDENGDLVIEGAAGVDDAHAERVRANRQFVG